MKRKRRSYRANCECDKHPCICGFEYQNMKTEDVFTMMENITEMMKCRLFKVYREFYDKFDKRF